jgi:tellurite resistance protein TerC
MDFSFISDFMAHTVLGEPAWLWTLFLASVFTILALDLGVFNRKDHVIGVSESLRLTGVYVVLGLLFGLWVLYRNGSDAGMDYYTIYLLEQSLSLDNLFVMAVIFSSFHVPREYQHRLLVWGIVGVIILRGLMIGTGAALVQSYEWVLFIFAAILIYTGFKMMVIDTEEKDDYTQKPYVRFLAKYLRVSDQIHGRHFFTKIHGPDHSKPVWYATPLFLALCTIELTDILFAFDSVPAALAITTDMYVVFTANIFAILGLRAMFFAMESLLHRFVYLKYSLSVVLVFIGVKVFYAHFFGKIHPGISLGITLGVLALGVIASLIGTKAAEEQKH